MFFETMSKKIAGNYLRAHRRQHGLSQRELALLVGYRNEWQVSRHECSKTIPPLAIALAYEIVFEIPVAQIFKGFQAAIAESVSRNCAELKADLRRRVEAHSSAKLTAHKLQWLTKRWKG